MLCDDHALVLHGLEKIINSFNGMQVVATATSGEDALGVINTGMQIDILLLDIGMPNGMNGYEVANRLNLHYPAIKVLVATQTTDPLAILWMIKLGAKGFISKNIQPPQLKDAIENVYQGNHFFKDHNNSNQYRVYLNSAAAIELNKKTASSLTVKEMEVARMMATDKPYKEIASILKLSESTIESYRQTIFKKLNAASRIEVALFMVRMGLF